MALKKRRSDYPKNEQFPFYSRKYGQFFKDYTKFKNYDKIQKLKWIESKHSYYKGKHFPRKRKNPNTTI